MVPFFLHAPFCPLSNFNPLYFVKLESKVHYFLFKYLTMHFQLDQSDWGYIKRNADLIYLYLFNILPLNFLVMFPPLPCLLHMHTYTLRCTHTDPANLRAHICVSGGFDQTFHR